MQNNLKTPGVILAAALLVFFAGGFLLLVHIGSSGRTAPARHYAPGYRGASVASSSYLDDFKRGGEIVKNKGEAAFAGFFGGSSREAPAYGRPASAGGGAGRAEEEDSDGSAFEEYYKKNYASSRGGSASAGQPSGAGMGGGAAAGGNPADEQGGPAGVAAGKSAETSAAAGEAAPGKPLFGGPAGRTAAQSPQLHASLSAAGRALPGLERSGELSGGGLSRAAPPAAGGSLQGMRGQKGKADLGGAEESARTSSAGSYNSKMSGGASASAAAGAAAGGAVPAASKPASAGAGGGSGAAADGGKDSKSAATDPKSAARDEAGGEETSAKEEPAGLMKAGNERNQPFLESVVVERLNGRDSKYITEEETKAALEESQLKAGASAPEEPREEKGFRPDGQRGERPPDPEKFTDLSEERKTQLKKRVHGFLKRVEIRYGEMDDIFYTPCSAGPELCSEHGLTEGYLTLETRDTAELHLGLKYVEDRWRRYTVGFTLPGGDRKWKHGRKKSAPESPEDSAPGENEQ